MSNRLTVFVPFPQLLLRQVGHGVMQGTNIAFGQAVRLVVSRGYDVLIDPMLGTVGFHSPFFEGGTFIRNDDIRVPKPWV